MQSGPKSLLEKLQQQLDEEAEKWNELGVSLDNTTQSPSSIFVLKCQMQAVINCMVQNDMTEDNLNKHFKTVMLNDMIAMREGYEEQRKHALYDHILGKPQEITVPSINIVGPDGREIKI